MTAAEKRGRSRGFWQGVITITVLWLLNDLLDPSWWVELLIAAGLGVVAGLLIAATEAAISRRRSE